MPKPNFIANPTAAGHAKARFSHEMDFPSDTSDSVKEIYIKAFLAEKELMKEKGVTIGKYRAVAHASVFIRWQYKKRKNNTVSIDIAINNEIENYLAKNRSLSSNEITEFKTTFTMQCLKQKRLKEAQDNSKSDSDTEYLPKKRQKRSTSDFPSAEQQAKSSPSIHSSTQEELSISNLPFIPVPTWPLAHDVSLPHAQIKFGFFNHSEASPFQPPAPLSYKI